jgi:hypothetical protein
MVTRHGAGVGTGRMLTTCRREHPREHPSALTNSLRVRVGD